MFANENETNRNESLKVENTNNENCNAPSVITSSTNGVKSPVVVTSPTNPSFSDATGSNNTSIAISPTTTSTTRRPSYTSKAPSALINLPKTIDEIDSNSIGNSSATSLQNIQTFALNGVELLDKSNNAALTEF